ncbi:HI1506-related protein [Martelella endophytica]|uniref:Uncharacterized protein n=1 Tax=Martelella endophytica TaxID=1486262 RepID=A0A0D5LRD3_MAREN|nr:HI1506-related protein [Martelella endophytica]AJY46485.1 hypothetical protein TM49_13635 [Martelella endophytica]
MADQITIICRNPGMRRAGIKHPASATYAADKFTKTELAAFRADPAFEVVDGEAPAATTVSALRTAEAEAKTKAEALATANTEIERLKGAHETAEAKLEERDTEITALKAELATAATKIAALEEAAKAAAKTPAKK